MPDEAPKTWSSPSLLVQWGPYFRPDPAEQKTIVDMTLAALGGSGGQAIVTTQAAVQKIAPIFGIDNVDAAIKALETEAAERSKKAVENAAAMQAIKGPVADGAAAKKPALPAKDDQ